MKDAEHVEICLGRVYGKGARVFMAIALARHKIVVKDSHHMASEVNDKTKRNFKTRSNNAIKTRNSERKKAVRDVRRAAVKADVENEDRIATLTNCERLKEEHKEDRATW